MAKSHDPAVAELPTSKSARHDGVKQKLPAIPRDYKVTKRPLLRTPVASKYSGPSTQKIVYVSTKMPFMAAVKKVQKLLEQTEKRQTQAARSKVTAKTRSGKNTSDGLEQIAATLVEDTSKRDAPFQWGEVVLKATGKAIEKTLGLGLWFQQRDEYTIHIKTTSVGAVDDIEPRVDRNGTSEAMEVDGPEQEDAVEVPESRVRYASAIEIYVSLAT